MCRPLIALIRIMGMITPLLYCFGVLHTNLQDTAWDGQGQRLVQREAGQ